MNIVLAGFGGQGVLFAGKVIAHAGLLEGREVSWLPSYGPEMRGGTANCSVCLGGLANMILLGRALAETGFAALDMVEAAIRKCIPPKKQHLAEPNLRALHLGMSV